MSSEEESQRRIAVQYALVHDMLAIGFAADALAAATVYSDIEVRIIKGQIEIGYADLPDIIVTGTRGVEPVSDNWKMAQAFLASSDLRNIPK